MSWFEEQLRFRKRTDDENFADSMDLIADAVTGKGTGASFGAPGSPENAVCEILSYYHYRPKTEELPAKLKTAVEKIEYMLRPYGIVSRGVELKQGWYRFAAGPMLGTLKESGYTVALKPRGLSGYYFTDPESGEKIRLNRKTEKLLEPEGICFYQPLPQHELKIADFLKFMFAQLRPVDLIFYFGLMGLSTLLGLLSPVFTKWLFGTVLESGEAQVLLAIAAFMCAYSVCRVCFSAYDALFNAGISVRQDIAVEAAVMNRVMHLPAAFYREYASGELTQRANYVQSLCRALFGTIGTAGITSVFSIVYIGQVFHYAPALVVPSILITLFTVLLSVSETFCRMRISRERMEQEAKLSGLTYATITGIEKIRLAGAEKRMFARWAKGYAKQAQYQYNPPAFLKLAGTLNLTVSLAGTLILYAAAVRSRVSLSDYYAFNAAYGMVSGAFMSLASIVSTVASIRPILEMVQPILKTEPEKAEGKEILTELRGQIEMNHVTFRYSPESAPVIDDLSLTIRPGEFVAVVGATGCGKSTLLRLLLGFEKPEMGSIYYDRKDLNNVDLKSVRRMIGTVMQDGKLFQGDIFSNIVIAAPDLTLRDAWEAAETAAIAEDIRNMPMGMNTVLSEGQGGISGGQRQRLMIARAVAPKPKVLMFDEATSALDNLTQKKVTDAIDGMHCTRIVIAHRLSTIRHADRILFLQKGKVAEEGTYEELIEKNGLFAALVERQRLDIDAE